MATDIPHGIYTASDRIAQLNDIDKEVVNLLRSAGLAVKALTGSASVPADEVFGEQSITIDRQKESFGTATSSYFATLSSLDVRLRRQIHALEEANILPTEASTKEPPINPSIPPGGPATGGTPNAIPLKITDKGTITGGGLGNLDVGWLNSRNDHVGKGKEAELWEEAQRLIERVEKGETDSKLGAEIQRYRDTDNEN